MYGPSGAQREIEVTVDTGYTGALMLPQSVVSELSLLRRSVGSATLADGSIRRFETFGAVVEWDGRPRGILVAAVGEEPLVGMKLLAGHRLTIQVEPGGEVEIHQSARSII